MRVLVVNTGSSSCKVRLIDPAHHEPVATASVERLGTDGTVYRVHVGAHRAGGTTQAHDVPGAFDLALRRFAEFGLDLSTDPPAAVGHRVVHGGQGLVGPTRIDDRVLTMIESVSSLDPLHNPACIAGIRAALRAFPGVPHIAVFDTAFFADLPKAAATYAIDQEVAAQHGIRRFGFHGISHEYVSREAARVIGRQVSELRQIVLHLGNGASISAIDKGRPIDTSMGLTPLEGLVMGTRSGDLDPGVLLHLARTANYTPAELETLLTRRSGLLGLTGRADTRDVVAAAARGDDAARLALDVVGHRLRKYIGGYLAVLGGLEVLTFTAGVGENSAEVRARALGGLEHLGIVLDPARNVADSHRARTISADHSAVQVLVVPTDEEWLIAQFVVDAL